MTKPFDHNSPYNARTKAKADERKAKMKALRDEGMSLENIGARFGGISRQRVSTILSRPD